MSNPTCWDYLKLEQLLDLQGGLEALESIPTWDEWDPDGDHCYCAWEKDSEHAEPRGLKC